MAILGIVGTALKELAPTIGNVVGEAIVGQQVQKLEVKSEAADAVLEHDLARVEGESEAADAALAADVAAIRQQYAGMVRWLIALSVGVIVAGLLAFVALAAVVITIAVLM